MRIEEDAQVEEIGVLRYYTGGDHMLFGEFDTEIHNKYHSQRKLGTSLHRFQAVESYQLTSSKTASEHLRCNIQVKLSNCT